MIVTFAASVTLTFEFFDLKIALSVTPAADNFS